MTPDVSFHALFIDGPFHLFVKTATKSDELIPAFQRLERLIRSLAAQLAEDEDEAEYARTR